MKVIVSLPLSLLGGVIAGFLCFFTPCGFGGRLTDCFASDPVKITLTFLLSWPFFVPEFLFHSLFYRNAYPDNFIGSVPAFILMWLYYYALVSLADYGERVLRKRYSSREVASPQARFSGDS
jgi:hypothetical protein